MNKKNMSIGTRLLAASAVFLALIAAGIYLQPGMSKASLHQEGDTRVVSFLTPLLKGSRGSIAAALITPQGVQYGLWNSHYDKQYEIASLTKTMTSSLLLEALRRGEVTVQTRIGELIPELAPPASDITLTQLVSHRSGLPTLAASLKQKIQMLKNIMLRDNIWNYDEKTLISMVNNSRLESPAKFEYSNTGYALLGLALERASHQPFATLLETRVFTPAKMTRSVIPDDITPDMDTFSHGWSASGMRVKPWKLHAFTPAGGVRSTIVDMAHYVQALLSEKIAGNEAMLSRFETDEADSRIGYGWFTTRIRGQNIVWHDGESSGFASAIAIDSQRKTAVIILSDTAWPVIGAAASLLLKQDDMK